MPKIIFSVCSQHVSVDKFTNNLSLFHVIEQINAPSFPFHVPQMFITSLWQRGDQEKGIHFESIIQFINPSGQTKGEWRADWIFEQPRHRHILLASNIEFDSLGTHFFKVYIRKKGELTLGEPASTIEVVVIKPT